MITIARCEVQFDDELLGKLAGIETKLESEILPQMLKAGGDVVLGMARSKLSSVIGHTKYPSWATGELESHIGISPAKLNNNGGMDVKIGFGGTHSGGEANAKLASILEHGRHGQPARPFIKPSASAASAAAQQAMKSKFDELVPSI